MTAIDKLTLELGAFSKPLSEQLIAQGAAFNAETVRHLEMNAEAISRLKVRGVVSYSAGNRLYDKIFKSVWREARRASLVAPAENSASSPSEASTSALAPDEQPLPSQQAERGR